MSQPSDSIRRRRTQKLLREALVELIEERGFEALTVGEITERALISRAAFYRNYADKYDLVAQIFDEAMRALYLAVGDLGRDHPADVWVTFFAHIGQYDRLYRALLGRKGSAWFGHKMRESLVGLMTERGKMPHESAENRSGSHTFSDTFVPVLVAALCVEAITWWLEHDKPYTPREMATRSATLIGALFREAGSWR